MLPLFQVRTLKPGEFKDAWPLVSLAHPSVTRARWLAFARRVASGRQGAGMFAVEDLRGFIHALAVFRVTDDVEKGRVLLIQPVICARLPGRDLDDVLADGLRDLAHTLACEGVVVETPFAGDAVKDTAKALLDRGFVTHAVASFSPSQPRSTSPGTTNGR
jgi:hypothetical protein